MPTTVTVTNGSTTATVIAVDDYFKETPEDLIATITGLVDQDDPDAFENLAIGDVNGNNTSATTTITDEADPDDDDTVYAVISVDDASIEEGEQAVFTVSLQDKDGNAVTAPNDIEVALVWSGVAATVDDVTPFPLPTSVTLTAGSGSVTVLATLDGVVEPDEPLTATIASITDPQDNYENYELGTPAGTGLSATTVIEDASALKVALTGADTVVEGESAEYTVTFEDAAGNPVALLAGQSVTVTLGTAAGLVLAATEGVDYVSVDGDTVTITGTAGGVSSTTFTVETTDDYLADNGEQYIVEISNPTSTGLGSTVGIATGKGTVTTTIADQTGTDDPPGTEDTVYAVISVDDASIEEGEQAVFTVSLQDKDGNAVTATSDIDVTLEWTGAAANAGDAAPLPTTVTVTNGSTTATVIAVDDYFKETPEDLIATITGLVDQDDPDAFENLAIGDVAGNNTSATTTITDEADPDDDDTVYAVISVDDASIEEGEQAVFTVSLQDKDGNAVTATSNIDVTLAWTGAAANAGDAAPLPTTVTVSQWQYDGDGDCGR